MNNFGIDEGERAVLAQLERLGPGHTKTMADSLGVSDRTVRRRIDSLTQRGVFKVVAVPNPVACGFEAWTKIGIRVLPQKLASVAQTLVQHPSVYFVAYSLGRFDIIIALLLDSNQALAHFINNQLAVIDGVVELEPWLMVAPRKYHQFKWLAPVCEMNRDGWPDHREGAPTSKVQRLDDKCRSILAILREDGLVKAPALALRVGLGESTVRNCLRDMQRQDLYRLSIVPNPEALGDEVWATIGIKAKKSNIDQVIDQIGSHSPVYLCTVTLGRFDIIVGARFAGNADLNRFVTEELPLIEEITSIETFVHYRPLKYHGIRWSEVVDGVASG